MILDTGLREGVRALWEKEMFFDLKLKVQSQEFQVHKVVLASVSDYFCTMFNNGMLMESQSDTIELKDLDASRMSNLIKFIYTGEDRLISYRPAMMLEYAVYFQMPRVIRECIKMMMSMLTIDTCLELLSVFTTYSLEDALKTVTTFIKMNLKMVKQHYKPKEMTPEGMQVILDSWTEDGYEIERFDYIKTWIGVEYDQRKKYIDELMGCVRFCLMTHEQILGIKENDLYRDGEGVFKSLIDSALAFLQLPIHHKVLQHSEQSTLRWPKAPVIIDIGPGEDENLFSYSVFKDKDNKSHWYTCGSLKGPDVTGRIPFVIEANNYLVTCSEFGEKQKWQILDPIALTWTCIANLPKPRDDFALLYHDKCLYVLGGREGIIPEERKVTDRIEEYSFESNNWTSTKKLPVALRDHSACVYNGAIYVSGGFIEDEDGTRMSDRMDRLDLTSITWERKAPMKKEIANHKMFLMRIMNKDTIVVISDDTDGYFEIYYYDPKTDEWSTGDFPVEEHKVNESWDDHDAPAKNVYNLEWGCDSDILVSGNTVYLLNVPGKEYVRDPLDLWTMRKKLMPKEEICVKWRFPVSVEDSPVISQFAMKDFPVGGHGPQSLVNFVAGVIALPHGGLVVGGLELPA